LAPFFRPEAAAPDVFSFRRAVGVATGVLLIGIVAARCWLVPAPEPAAMEESARSVVQLEEAEWREEEAPLEERANVARPSRSNPAVPAVVPGFLHRDEPAELEMPEWELPPAEPFEHIASEKAHEPFPSAEAEPPAARPERRRSDREAAPPRRTSRAGPRPVTQPARVLRRFEPGYPRSARRAGIEGRVVLNVRVRPDGRVGSVRVVTSSGSAVLDSAAISAVKRWAFAPERRGDRPVASTVQVPFRFELE